MFKVTKRLMHIDTSGALDLARKTSATEHLWRHVSPEKKREIFFKAADLLDMRRPQLVQTMEVETKTPTFFGNLFIDDAISYIRELACIQATYPNVLPVQAKDRIPMVFREPIGTVLGIVPWNAAAVLAVRAAACPLAAGCPVVIKTSPLAEKSHQQTLQVFEDAGLPKDVLNIIHIDEQSTANTISSLIADDSIKKINFTGSLEVGKTIALDAAKNIKPVLLELGGKGAVIVDLDSMDNDKPLQKKAAENIILGAWANGGHVCMSTERVYVVSSCGNKVEEFVGLIETMSEHLAELPFMQSESIHHKQASKVQDLVQQAISGGAKVLVSKNLTENPLVVPRVVLRDVSLEMQIHQEETFGPVCFLNTVKDMKTTIREVNSHESGLNNAVWSGNIAAAINVARQLESGAVHINGSTIFDHGTIPHGGTKKSGYGRFGAQWGIDEFSYMKTVTIPSS